MRCPICKHGEIGVGRVIVTLQRGETTVIAKQVPADVCDNCGEYYLSEETASRVLASAEDAAARGAEVEILRFVA